MVVIIDAYADLPDFTDLVEEVSPAVVKINTVSVTQRQSSQQRMPDIFRDFLRTEDAQKGLFNPFAHQVLDLLSQKMVIF